MVGGDHPLSSVFAAASDGPEGRKGVMIRTVILAFREAARSKLVKEFPELRHLIAERWREAVHPFPTSG